MPRHTALYTQSENQTNVSETGLKVDGGRNREIKPYLAFHFHCNSIFNSNVTQNCFSLTFNDSKSNHQYRDQSQRKRNFYPKQRQIRKNANMIKCLCVRERTTVSIFIESFRHTQTVNDANFDWQG